MIIYLELLFNVFYDTCINGMSFESINICIFMEVFILEVKIFYWHICGGND